MDSDYKQIGHGNDGLETLAVLVVAVVLVVGLAVAVVLGWWLFA